MAATLWSFCSRSEALNGISGRAAGCEPSLESACRAVTNQKGPRVGEGAHGRLWEAGEVSMLQGKRLRGTATFREGCTLRRVQAPKLDSARAFASFSLDE